MIGYLAPRWIFAAHGEVQGAPTVEQNGVYAPNSGSNSGDAVHFPERWYFDFSSGYRRWNALLELGSKLLGAMNNKIYALSIGPGGYKVS